VHFVGQAGRIPDRCDKEPVRIVERFEIGHHATQQYPGISFETVERHAIAEITGDGQRGLPSKLCLDQRQYGIDEPAQRVEIWASHLADRADEQQSLAF